MNKNKLKTMVAVVLLALWGTAAAGATPAQELRDSLLKVITGAKQPTTSSLLITNFGARGDGKKDCKPAFDKAMDKARQKGGAHIVVPAGTYLVKGPPSCQQCVS